MSFFLCFFHTDHLIQMMPKDFHIFLNSYLISIIFRPTTSKNENLPLIYYQAELDGIHDQCHHYEQECSESILDLISSPIHQIIDELQRNTNG